LASTAIKPSRSSEPFLTTKSATSVALAAALVASEPAAAFRGRAYDGGTFSGRGVGYHYGWCAGYGYNCRHYGYGYNCRHYGYGYNCLHYGYGCSCPYYEPANPSRVRNDTLGSANLAGASGIIMTHATSIAV
jgi:hypothetical protein